MNLNAKPFNRVLMLWEKKKALLWSTVSELVKDTDRFSLEAENAKEMHGRDETVVVQVKLF